MKKLILIFLVLNWFCVMPTYECKWEAIQSGVVVDVVNRAPMQSEYHCYSTTYEGAYYKLIEKKEIR